MQHYTVPGIVKTLAAKLVDQQIASGSIKVRSSRQYRDAVVAAAHTAWIEVSA